MEDRVGSRSPTQAFHRRLISAVLPPLFLGIVLVPLTVFALAAAAQTGLATRSGDLARVVLFFTTLWTILILITIPIFQEQRFSLQPSGITLPHRPIAHVLRRKRIVPLDDVVVLRFQPQDLGMCARLKLRDGPMVELKEWEGVPREAFGALRHLCSEAVVGLPKTDPE